MIVLAIQAFSLYALSWIFWRLLQRLVVGTAFDNIPGPPSHSIITGNTSKLFDADAWDFHEEVAAKYGGVARINAVLGEKHLYVSDPRALYHVVVKDRHIYGKALGDSELYLGKGLLTTKGEHHRKQRKMLNPVFSIAHMRQMVPVFYEVTDRLRAALALKVANGPQEIDMLHWMSRTALELIGQSGLGYSFDSLAEQAIPHPYAVSIKELVPMLNRLAFPRTYILPWAMKIGTPSFRRFIIDILPWKDVRTLRDHTDMMHNTSVRIFEEKKRALMEGDEVVARQIGQGKDILSILMRANMVASNEDRLPESEVLAQMTTLTFAAMDTTSAALSRILHLLATHPEVQETLRKEVIEARKEHGDMSYDELVSLPYLDAICRETLRLHPPVPTLARKTQQDTVLPLSKPIKGVDGSDIHEIAIPNNTKTIISIISINRNTGIWGPDASEWKPERWLSPLPDTVINARIPGIYSHLMTFTGGRRACIGFKFSQLEMKVVLSILIASFRFSLSEKEIIWKMNGIAAPALKDGRDKSIQLPMKVTLV